MANYLVVESGEVPIMHEVDAKNIARAIEQLDLSDGESVTVYRIANKRKATVVTEEVKRVEIQ